MGALDSAVYEALPEDSTNGMKDGSKQEAAKGAAFKDLYVSNFFDGADPWAIIKAMAPMQVLTGLGVLFAALLPRFLALALAALLLLPPAVRLLLRLLRLRPNPDMDRVLPQRYTARVEGDFCVLLIGSRCNAPWKLSSRFKDMGEAFNAMVEELESQPVETSGFLGADSYVGTNWQRSSHTMVVMYWRSYDHLLKYAHDRDMKHVPTWLAAEKMVKASSDIGIWHEAYQVKAGKYDSIYVNCPPLGLGMCGKIEPAVGHFRSSRGRCGGSDGKDLPKHVTDNSEY